MKLFKVYISLCLLVLTILNSFSQNKTRTLQHTFDVNKDVVVEITSKYTNLEFSYTDDDVVTIEAIMIVEGLTENEVEEYFKKWNPKPRKHNNKIIVSSVAQHNSNVEFKMKGYYEGYFLDTEELSFVNPKPDNKANSRTHHNEENIRELFDFDTYIEQGNDYLEQWEKKHNEKIAKRWYNKTKEERIKLRKPKKPEKETVPVLDNKPAIVNKDMLKKKNELPNVNVRDLSKRAVVSKTLKVKIPRNAKVKINAKHGKIVFTDEVKNLDAELKYVLVNASTISGKETFINGSYSNFEIDHWLEGKLEIMFSDYTLIKKVNEMTLTSNASVVSIDDVTTSIEAKGNFKMLSIDVSSEMKHVSLNLEDSKRVWLKLPKTPFKLKYKGIDSKLIHPEKFKLTTSKSNGRIQIIESNLSQNNGSVVNINSLSCVMQIYDIPWENLKIKSLQE